ncbi:MAG: hypothetical protein ACE366_04515 [Bradymonadia bacterium]
MALRFAPLGSKLVLGAACLLALHALTFSTVASAQNAPGAKETQCDNGVDDDNDSLPDCADSDCTDTPACAPDGNPESTDQRCSDWVDNDQDGATDCDDSDCQASFISVCSGSWSGSTGGETKAKPKDNTDIRPDLPGLADGVSAYELIGKGGDIDGERNDYLCSDGIDNDGDGRIDCADYGCRFDDSVRVCQGAPGLRFSVVAMAEQSFDIEQNRQNGDLDDAQKITPWDTRISRLQLRALGPIPQIQNSFFLVQVLAERTPRLSFAMFSVPLGRSGHFMAINSGAAGLSQIGAVSVHKQLFLDRTDLFRAMEQFNSSAIEFTGPLTSNGKLMYRTFAAGGAGRFDGNVGGRSVNAEGANYSWAGGGALTINLKGYYSRFDTPFLYTPVPLTAAAIIGAKYDQRDMERYASVNVHVPIRWNRLLLIGEYYGKQEFEFESTQHSYLIQAGFLAIPRKLFLAADFGSYLAGDYGNPPETFTGELRNQRDETEIRAAAHYYFFRNIGVMSLVYRNRDVKSGNGREGFKEELLRLVAQFRF